MLTVFVVFDATGKTAERVVRSAQVQSRALTSADVADLAQETDKKE